MLANYLAAAIRNLGRDRLHSAITALSLAIGFAAAILAGVYHRYEYSYDRFWPNFERLYMVAQWQEAGPGVTRTSDAAEPRVADYIRQDVAAAAQVARLTGVSLDLERGETRGRGEVLYAADPNLFQVLKPPAIEGELSAALAAPGALVLTRSLAAKYFGDASAVGRTVTAYRDQGSPPVPLRVTAVVEDLPVNGHLSGEGFVSASTFGAFPGAGTAETLTYVLARPGAGRAALQTAMDAVADHRMADPAAPVTLKVFPLSQAYMKTAADDPSGPHVEPLGLRIGDFGVPLQMKLLAGLILVVGAINYITLMTAKGARRAVEVGVRKASGARRSDLIVQFLGESVLYVVLAFVAAVAMAELAEPLIRAMTGSNMRFSHLQDLTLIGGLFAGALAVGIAAGVYPAFALSGYKPAAVLKGGPVKSAGSAALRQTLIAVQFTPLIVLALLATSLLVGASKAQAVSRNILPGNPLIIAAPCVAAFKDRILQVEGVRAAACLDAGAWAGREAYGYFQLGRPAVGEAIAADGDPLPLAVARASVEELSFHRMKLVAGRAPTAEDEARGGAVVLLNQTTAAALGFARPEAAVGRELSWGEGRPSRTRQTAVVAGVFADRGARGLETVVIVPTPAPAGTGAALGVHFTGDADRAAAVAAIDALGRQFGLRQPLDRYFLHDRLAEQGARLNQDLRFLFLCLGVGVFVGALGLFGVAAFLAERRTKEIGVRKAMGADRAHVATLMLSQFAFPVLLANLIAVPIGWGVFTVAQMGTPAELRLPTGLDVIVPVVLGAVLVTVASTFLHAWRAASAPPIQALRYE